MSGLRLPRAPGTDLRGRSHVLGDLLIFLDGGRFRRRSAPATGWPLNLPPDRRKKPACEPPATSHGPRQAALGLRGSRRPRPPTSPQFLVSPGLPGYAQVFGRESNFLSLTARAAIRGSSESIACGHRKVKWLPVTLIGTPVIDSEGERGGFARKGRWPRLRFGLV